jgi:hypothetical protein
LECTEDAFASRRAAPRIDDALARCTQHERRESLSIANHAGAQFLERDNQHLLDKVGRSGLIPQMTQPKNPDAGCEPPADLRLGCGITLGRGRSNTFDESRVLLLRCNELGHRTSIKGRLGDRNRHTHSLHEAYV